MKIVLISGLGINMIRLRNTVCDLDRSNFTTIKRIKPEHINGLLSFIGKRIRSMNLNWMCYEYRIVHDIAAGLPILMPLKPISVRRVSLQALTWISTSI